MLNLNNKTFPKLISLVLAQIFLLTSVIYPESSPNRSISSVYIHDRDLRVPMMAAGDHERLDQTVQEAAGLGTNRTLDFDISKLGTLELKKIEEAFPVFGRHILGAIDFLRDRTLPDGTLFLDGISNIKIIGGSDTTSAEKSENNLVIRLNDTSFLDHASEQEKFLYFLYILASARGTFGEAPQQQALQGNSPSISKEGLFERVILKDSVTGETFMLVANFKRDGNRDKTRQNVGLFSDPSQEFSVNSTIIQEGNCTEVRSRRFKMPFDKKLSVGIPTGCEIFRFIPHKNPVFRTEDIQEILGVFPDLKEVLSFFIAAGVFKEEKNADMHRITVVTNKEENISAEVKVTDAKELIIKIPHGRKPDLTEAIEVIAQALGKLDLSPQVKKAEKEININETLRGAINKAQKNIDRTREPRRSAIEALWKRKKDIYRNMVKDSPLDKYIKKWVSKNAPNLKDFFIASWQMEMGFHPELSLSLMEALQEEVDKGNMTIEEADILLKKTAMSSMAGGLGALMVCFLRALADNGADILSLNLLYENYTDERTGHLVKTGDLMRRALERMGAQIIDNIEVEYEGKKYNVKAYVCKLGYATQVWIDCLDAESLDRLYKNTNDSRERASQVKFYNEAGQAVIRRLKAEGIVDKAKRIDFEQELYTNLDKAEEPAEYTFGTNHTVEPGGMPKFVKQFFEALLADLLRKYGSNIIDNENKLHLEVLGLFRALRVFGVSKDHADILLREVFPAALRKVGIDPESQRGKELLKKIVTGPDAPSNGTHAKHFQAPEIQELLYKSMAEYVERFEKTYEDIAEDDSGFIKFLKEDKKTRGFLMKSLDDVMPALQSHLLNLLRTQGINWEPDIKNPIGCIIRRIVDYKQLPRVVRELFENPEKMKRFKESGRRLIIGGRFKPELLDHIRQIIKDNGIESQIAVIEDYNISDAAIIFQGISFWDMLSRRGEEAASTSGTKALSEGKPGIGVPDGVFHTKDGYLEEFDFNTLTGNGFFVKYTSDGEVDIDSLLDCFDNMGKVFANDTYRQHIQFNSLVKWLEKGNIVMHQARKVLKVMNEEVGEAENLLIVSELINNKKVTLKADDNTKFEFNYNKESGQYRDPEGDKWVTNEWVLLSVKLDGKVVGYAHGRIQGDEIVMDISKNWADIDDDALLSDNPEEYRMKGLLQLESTPYWTYAIEVNGEIKSKYNGIGTTLMNFIAYIGKNQGARRIKLIDELKVSEGSILKDRIRNREFFKNLGFPEGTWSLDLEQTPLTRGIGITANTEIAGPSFLQPIMDSRTRDARRDL